MDLVSKEIIEKYKEFSDFLNDIDLDSLEKELDRKELIKLRDELRDINLRSIPYYLGEIIDKKKKEEFPQLLGVHRFPIISNIDFLSEEQLIILDKDLAGFRVGNYVNDGIFYDAIGSYDKTDKDKLVDWLIENGVLKREYAVVCSYCKDCHISRTMSFEEKKELEKKFTDFKDNGNYYLWEYLYSVLDNGCMECDTYEELEDMKELHFTSFVKMNMNRDTSLDHV